MNREKLQELTRLANEATPGPWIQGGQGEGGDDDNHPDADLVYGLPPTEWWICKPLLKEADAAFIAASRTAVPDLIAEVERLRALLPAYIVRSQFRAHTVYHVDDFEEAKGVASVSGGPLIRVSDGAIFDGAGWLIDSVLVEESPK